MYICVYIYICVCVCVCVYNKRQQQRQSGPYLIQERGTFTHARDRYGTASVVWCGIPFDFQGKAFFNFFLTSATHSYQECHAGLVPHCHGPQNRKFPKWHSRAEKPKMKTSSKAAMHCLLCHVNQQKVVPLTLENKNSECTAVCIPKRIKRKTCDNLKHLP
jgi:hypothetical protein